MGVVTTEDFERLSAVFRGERGRRRAEIFMRMIALDRINRLYDNSSAHSGSAFAAGLLNDLGVNYYIGNAERLNFLPEGAFITVSNHPYGGLDGIILVDLFDRIRDDYKLMVNQILSLVRAMKGNFIEVTPSDKRKKGITATSIGGIRETIARLKEGHPVGFFPAGAVSDLRLKSLTIRDRPWQQGILRLIHSAKVPILPVRFFDRNSLFFYSLGLINWRIRMLRLPSEVFNKYRKVHRIGIGKIISVREQEKFPDSRSLGAFLRKTIYKMPLPASFIPRNRIHFKEKQKGNIIVKLP
ncbi:MAG TPA: hemolysin [Bacteroides sp.]|nr:hemolysin [Bacteroides sp.]